MTDGPESPNDQDKETRLNPGAPRALLVEDNPEQLALRAGLLTDLGVDVMAVGDLSTALELLESTRFDVVVTDINLGEVPGDRSGLALAAEAKRLQPRVPVVGYSALYRADDFAPEEIGHFTRFFQKGSQRSSSVMDALRQIADLARATLDEGT